MYKCKSFSLYNLECSPYYWLIQSEQSFINSSLLLLLMKVLQHLKITIAINENMSRFEAYMYKRFWPRSITNLLTVHLLSAFHLSIVINKVDLKKKNDQKFARLTTTWPFGVLKPWTEFHCAGHAPQNTSDLESNSLPTPWNGTE